MFKLEKASVLPSVSTLAPTICSERTKATSGSNTLQDQDTEHTQVVETSAMPH